MAPQPAPIKKTRKRVVQPVEAEPRGISLTDEEAIKVRAYELWQERGCPIGPPEVDWENAKAQVIG